MDDMGQAPLIEKWWKIGPFRARYAMNGPVTSIGCERTVVFRMPVPAGNQNIEILIHECIDCRYDQIPLGNRQTAPGMKSFCTSMTSRVRREKAFGDEAMRESSTYLSDR